VRGFAIIAHVFAPHIWKLGALVKNRFTSEWEPTLLSEEILASGVWFYDDQIPFSAKLLKQKYDYTSFDLPEIEVTIHPYNLDYIDYSISDEGFIYFWQFEGQGRKSKSPTFSTYFAARDHINSYGTKYDISW